VSAFRALQQSEQILLLKGGSIELLILRSVLTFDPDKQQFLDPTDSPETRAMKVDQLQSAVPCTGLFDAHMAFVRSVAVDLRADETMLVLLLVISLFSPDRASDEGMCVSNLKKIIPLVVVDISDIKNKNDIIVFFYYCVCFKKNTVGSIDPKG